MFEKNKKYRIKSGEYSGSELAMDGKWTDLMDGKKWSEMMDNPACLQYGIRAVNNHLPVDDKVWYGHIGIFGHLVHETEIGEEIP